VLHKSLTGPFSQLPAFVQGMCSRQIRELFHLIVRKTPHTPIAMPLMKRQLACSPVKPGNINIVWFNAHLNRYDKTKRKDALWGVLFLFYGFFFIFNDYDKLPWEIQVLISIYCFIMSPPMGMRQATGGCSIFFSLRCTGLPIIF
jgi:hypothetical protein